MTLNLPLPDSIQNFINEQLAIGGYSNAVEYILHLIRQEQARAARVESLLLAGLDSGNSIEITDDWWEQKRAQLVQNFQSLDPAIEIKSGGIGINISHSQDTAVPFPYD